LKPHSDLAVARWLDAQDPETLYLTATVLSEVLIGIALLLTGKRKRGMELAMQSPQSKLFAGRFLSFDRQAAIAFALLGSRAAARGYSISVADCPIAAIAAAHGFAVATRDTAPFLAAGVPVINPWKG
jgi:predicted nucleic acid-binding protein